MKLSPEPARQSSISAKIQTNSSSAPRFQMISGMQPLEKAIAQFLRTDSAFRLCLMLSQTPAQ
jgi:hypothetical protein